MNRTHKKKENKQRLTIIILIIIAILVWFLAISKYNVINIIKNKILIEQKKKKIANMELEENKLRDEKKLLKDKDPEYIEKKARERGLSKPGEIIIRIKEEKTDKNKSNE